MVVIGLPGDYGPVLVTVAAEPRLGNKGDKPSENPFSAILEPSEEATTLLSRTNEGVKRGDWKLAIDSLQRIIELPGEHVLTSDGRLYESARWYAHRRLASLPAVGLRAYRLMYDGEAAALLARARRHHDPAPLRTIVDKFLITRCGDDAAVTLADWLIDEGRFSEAAALLQRIQLLYPDSDLPAWAIPSRRVVCAAATGQYQRAQAMLKALREHPATTRPATGSGPGHRARAESPKAAGRPALADRIEQIAAYLDRVRSGPATLGVVPPDGKTPAVEPAFLEDLPWCVRLPLTVPREGFSAIKRYARRRHALPVRQIVTHGGVLIVKGERELLALDLESFTPIWTSQTRLDETDFAEPQQPAQAVAFRFPEQKESTEEDPLLRRLFYDYVGGSVAIAFDMALTVEWPGEPPHLDPMGLKRTPGPGVAFVTGASLTVHPNRVVAYSLEDGSLLWASDTLREAGPAGGSGEMEFLSVPIPVDGYLLAPCRMNGELYAAVLDPMTGKLVRHVYLCGTGSGPFNSFHALIPCVADGVAFIPTGRGMLFALEVSSWSIRWAVRYEPTEGDVEEFGWLPTPVVAVADVVLLAPGDVNELLCLDRGTGEVRWRVPREDFACLLGATDTCVWMAGEHVQLLQVETGRSLWKKACGEPTGRGVITGERIYLPTLTGVVAMDAMTGEAIEIDQPLEPLLLGNLLAWDGALYSASLLDLRRFPDLKQGYVEAVERHDADPTSPSRSIRLAWLELLKDQPARALAALASVPETLKDEDPRAHANVNHLRVRAMLELAASGERTPVEALKLLEDARATAQSGEDAVQAALALGDHHRRQGRPLEGCFEYLSLALSDQGDQMSSPDGGFERRARSIASDRIAEAARDLSEDQAKTFEYRLRDWLSQAVEHHDDKSLLWLAESSALGNASSKAALILGTRAGQELRFESAEGLFARVLRQAESPALLAEAAARLAALYLEPGEFHLPVSAAALLDRLEHELAAVELPADVLDTAAGPKGDAPLKQSRPPVRAARVAAALRKRIDAEILARHQATLARIRLGQPHAPTVTVRPGARPLSIRGRRTEPMADALMVLADGQRVEAHTADDGKELWLAELQLLGEPAVRSGSAARAQVVRGAATVGSRLARGVAAGQTLIVNTAHGLHAIGLLTGRRLWSRAFDPPAQDHQEPSGSDTWMWAHAGFLVSVNARSQLEVSYVNQGERVLWRRSLPDRQWYAVRARGSYVVAVDPALEKVDVFRLSDGRYLGRCQFTQDVSPGGRVNLTLYDEVICGPVSPKQVAAVELAAPGTQRWRVSMTDKLSQLFKPTPELVAIADRSGHLRVIDPENGKKQLAVTVYACEQGVTEGALANGVLYVSGYQKRLRPPDRYDDQRWALAAIRMRDGQTLWRRSDIPARAHLSADVLQASSNAIPVAVFLPSALAGTKELGSTVELTVLDKATGEVIGEKAVAPLPKSPGTSQVLEVEVWPGRIIVNVGSHCLRFPVELDDKQ